MLSSTARGRLPRPRIVQLATTASMAAPAGRRKRSAMPTINPAATPTDLGVCEENGVSVGSVKDDLQGLRLTMPLSVCQVNTNGRYKNSDHGPDSGILCPPGVFMLNRGLDARHCTSICLSCRNSNLMSLSPMQNYTHCLGSLLR